MFLKLLKNIFLKLKLWGFSLIKYIPVLVLYAEPREQIIPSEILEVSY